MENQPYKDIRIIELSNTLSGRLIGLLFADQGAEVYIVKNQRTFDHEIDTYLNRNKKIIDTLEKNSQHQADIILTDGNTKIDALQNQIVARIYAALPEDEIYGYLPADCSDDLLSALIGFYTDMSITGKYLGREAIYTPLPLCSVYAAVDGAIAISSALIQRVHTGQGQEIWVSRIAGGLSAIGALALTSRGLDSHLNPANIAGLPDGMSLEEARKMITEAVSSAEKQLFLEQRLIPMAAPYYTSDNKMILPLCAANRRLAAKLCQQLDIWDELQQAGAVDVNPYDPDNQKYAKCNIADSMSMNYVLNCKLSTLLNNLFKKKTAKEWFTALSENGIPCEIIQSFESWLNDEENRMAGLVANVEGLSRLQLGRSAWLRSAQPYPPLKQAERVDHIPLKPIPEKAETSCTNEQLPLHGYKVVDFSNVLAGPNCGRMLAELGAKVIKIEPVNPQHTPTIMTTWAAESGVGKASIVLDMQSRCGKNIMNEIIADADIVLMNKRDNQVEHMGLDSASLAALNPKIIGLQLTARGGEKTTAMRLHPGYDPSIQGHSGIMERFGPKGCPTYHGVASCVDYLCGYLGVWAGVSALYSREGQGRDTGDWAEASLTSAAVLTQCLLQFQPAPESAIGPYAFGASAGKRIYKLKDGCIFAEAESDLSDILSQHTVTTGLDYLKKQSILAVPVQTVRALADKHRQEPCKTIRFESREKQGWFNENFAPTWFAFHGKTVSCPGPASRIGSDAYQILSELNYSDEEIKTLIQNGIVGPVEWNKNRPPEKVCQ